MKICWKREELERKTTNPTVFRKICQKIWVIFVIMIETGYNARYCRLKDVLYLNNRVFLSRNYQTDSSEINTLLSLLFTSKFSSARHLKNSQNPLNADQSNIYSCVQLVINVIIRNCILAK